jgi:thioredoxin 2
MEPAQTLHIACGHCLTANRVSKSRLADGPNCSKCGHGLIDGLPVELDDTNFEAFTSRTDMPVIVDFWAPWCGPCRGMAPQFEQAARQLKGRVLFAKVDSDASPQTSRQFGIRSIPTLVRLQGGREQARHSGALQASEIALFAL